WDFAVLHVLLAMALVSHIAVMVSDPGQVPKNAVPLLGSAEGTFCHQCQAYKPPRAHHCRHCNICVSRMDHHCAFASNCIGAGNQKEFLQLLLYSAASRYNAAHPVKPSMVLWSGTLVGGLLLLILMWVSALLVSQIYGIGVGAGAIDRLQ
ncbi:unnamed protein product, partial [Discosporangium mesarthrocarpum]